MIGGSLVMPSNSTSIGSQRRARLVNDKVSDGSSFPSGNRNVDITIGSQTLFGTVDGTVGSIIGLGGKTFAFLSALQRAMDAIVRPVGDLSHAHFRAWKQDQNRRGSCGFVDGDWIETFLDLNRRTMEKVVMEMNVDPRWTIRDDGKGFGVQGDDVRQNLIDTDEGMGALASTRTLSVEDVLAAVEELSMVH
jgi:DNA damage-binding protein 1